MNEIKITVFTPTYNRGYIIEKLYYSLEKQSDNNFEWIVIDDGSTDNTEKLFDKIRLKHNKFPITYIKKQNGGKHRAINDAVKIAKGKLFFIVDSDDQLTTNAIEKINLWYAGIAGLKEYAGVAGLKGHIGVGENELPEMIGTTFYGNWLDATSLEQEEYHITGDKAEVFYTDLLKKNPFPEFEGENFITEAIVWNRVAETGLKLRWFNEIIYLCEYQEDGLTRNLDEINRNNPRGYALELTEKIRLGNYGRRDVINIFYHYYTVVSGDTSLIQCAQYLNIFYLEMVYIVARCRGRDWIRKLWKVISILKRKINNYYFR